MFEKNKYFFHFNVIYGYFIAYECFIFNFINNMCYFTIYC